MAPRFTKDKARTETARLKDIPAFLIQTAAETGRKPSDGRDENGHFAPNNRHAIDQGIKALLRRGLGDPDDPTVGAMVREATRLYLAIMRRMPSDGPAVRQLVAAQARNAMLATSYANEAAKAGLGSDRGLKLAEAARAHDKTAQGLSTAAFDRALKEAAGKPKAANPILAAIEARAAKASEDGQ